MAVTCARAMPWGDTASQHPGQLAMRSMPNSSNASLWLLCSMGAARHSDKGVTASLSQPERIFGR